MSRITLESATGTRRVRWYSALALVLAPLLLASIVLVAVANANERLSDVSAAIVNNDDGAEIDGQTVPLGRQLSAGLVEGSDNEAGIGNYNWVLTDAEDAEEGLAAGRYAAVVTIPEDFSAKATSFSDAATAESAVVNVETSEKARIADGAIGNYITSTAAEVFGASLSEGFIDGILVGFNTLNEQLGTAADGAVELADGTTQLADGLDQLADGTQASADGSQELSTGVSAYMSGVSKLASGLKQLSSGTKKLPAQVSGIATGMRGVADGVGGISQLAQAQPDMTLAELDAFLVSNGSSLAQLAGGADQLATGTSQLASGLKKITGGISASASGADQLASNGSALTNGVGQLADGLDQLAAGTEQSASGAQKLADGTTELADGLGEAVDGIPTYSKSERDTLADVVTSPVGTQATSVDNLVERSGLPLLLSLALWIGAFAVYFVLQAVSRRALTSRRSSVALAASSLVPGAIVGAVQGLALAAIMQISLGLDVGEWFALAGVSVLAGIAFAAVVQGIVAILGNGGRLLAALMAVVVLAAGLISTSPALLTDLAELLPISAASTAASAIISGSGSLGSSIGSLVLWGLIGFALSTAAVISRRTVRVKHLTALPVD